MPNPLMPAAVAVLLASAAIAQPVTTSFTYQGELRDGGSPAAGTCDLRFRLYDALTGGTQVGPTLCTDDTSLLDGRFTALLDFGSQFAGQQRFLEVEVRANSGLGCANPAGFIILGPRQELSATPNALFALSAGTAATATTATTATTAATASNAALLNGQAASFFTNAGNLTGTLPPGVFAGTFPSAVTLTNPGNSFTGSGAGLTGVDAATLNGLDASDFLQVAGPFSLSGTSAGEMLRAENDSSAADSAAIRGLATALTGASRGVYGSTLSPSGAGVMGEASTGAAAGVYGFSPSTTGYGLYGWANSTTGPARGVYGQSNSTNGMGVYGRAAASSGAAHGVFGLTSSVGGAGVFGECGITGGLTTGVQGQVQSVDGRGVYGRAYNTGAGTGTGVWGESAALSGRGVFGSAASTSGVVTGVWGESASPAGRGVYALNSATTGGAYGLHAQTASTTGRAVFGEATAFTGANYGVYGLSGSSSGFGVFGMRGGASGLLTTTPAAVRADTSAGHALVASTSFPSSRAVLAQASADHGFAVEGHSSGPDGLGVFAQATGSQSNAGIWAENNSGQGYGVFGKASIFNGTAGTAVFANGTFAASGIKSFRIDHPADPQHKYLLHYCTESPRPQNSYTGSAVLDERGEALVTLPDYFAAINTDPQYTLTAVGQPMPMLHIAQEVDTAALSAGATVEPGQPIPTCSFRIAGGAPGGRVSWRIEAARNDRWVQQRGAPVEVEKPGRERGLYQHPELYGQPSERGITPRPAGVSDAAPHDEN